ncbi:MAG: serine/threonine protein kinase [Acidobacteria bacterium]|nr:MAG: serine/threonine protein kinase [Acidobacteriota bacterium]
MDGLRHDLDLLWLRLHQALPWLEAWETWLRTPQGLAAGGGAVALLVAMLVLWRHWRRGQLSRAAARTLRREARGFERAGEWRAAGNAWRRLGKARKALAAYRRGGHHDAAARLLLDLGRRREAKEAARKGAAWGLYARLCDEDGEHQAAARAYLQADQLYAAALSLEKAGDALAAARTYRRAGMLDKALELALKSDAEGSAGLLESLVRRAGAGAARRRGSAVERGLRRAVELRLAAGEAERAYRLAADCERLDLALPIARRHLPPSADVAEAFARQGLLADAAELYQRLGDEEQAALYYGEHCAERGANAEAAPWFERAGRWDAAAEHWAAAGQLERAAAAYEKAGDYRQAARFYGQLGDRERQRLLEDRAAASDPLSEVGLDPAAPTSSLLEPPAGAGLSTPVPPAAGSIDAQARYVAEAELGRGAMGIVYRARDTILDRPVALKLLPRELSEAPADEVLKEARAAARLSHPNIVQVFDAGRGPRGFFIVMELVAGSNFAVHLEHHRLDLAEAVRIGRQICAALGHAHERQIVHRDLKPSNLLWTTAEQIKLTDFGLARAFEAAHGGVMTRPAGTPCYMAPEQIQGGKIDPRTDLYSLGCVLFELLVHRPPFQGERAIYDQLHTPPPDPRQADPRVPDVLADLILRCLAKEPDQRPASAAAIDRELAALAPLGSDGGMMAGR